MESDHSGDILPEGESVRPDTLIGLFFFSIPFWIPALIGLYLVAQIRNKLSLMAGLLTLKPIVTTPLWAAIFYYFSSHYILPSTQGVGGALVALCSILPGASLTLLILVIFRHLLFGSRSTSAWVLILLDCMRWLNSGLLTAAGSISYYDVTGPFACIFGLVGLLFPTAYAIVALTTTLATQEPGMGG